MRASVLFLVPPQSRLDRRKANALYSSLLNSANLCPDHNNFKWLNVLILADFSCLSCLPKRRFGKRKPY